MSARGICQCPTWCRDDEPHHRSTYDTIDDRTLIRTHSVDIGQVGVVQDEHLIDGSVVLMPAAVHSYVPQCEDLTAEEARQIGADFLAAADRLEHITT